MHDTELLLENERLRALVAYAWPYVFGPGTEAVATEMERVVDQLPPGWQPPYGVGWARPSAGRPSRPAQLKASASGGAAR